MIQQGHPDANKHSRAVKYCLKLVQNKSGAVKREPQWSSAICRATKMLKESVMDIFSLFSSLKLLLLARVVMRDSLIGVQRRKGCGAWRTADFLPSNKVDACEW